jgi:hypothetical protein
MTRWVKDKSGKFLGSLPSGEVKPIPPQDSVIQKLVSVPDSKKEPSIADVHTSFATLLEDYAAQSSDMDSEKKGFLSEKYDEAIQWIHKYPSRKIAGIHSIMTRSAWMKGRNATRKIINSLTEEQVYAWLSSKPKANPEKTVLEVAKIFDKTPKEVKDRLNNNEPKTLTKVQKEVLEKIDSLWEDQGMNSAKVLLEAKNDGYIISSLQKNPTKQNIYEPTVAAYIQEKAGTPVLILASARNKISVRFSANGEYDVSGKSKDKFSKDADLAIIVPNGDGIKVFLASHKYGRVPGGHQDNQKKDAAAFLAGADSALRNHKDIPELRELVGKSLGRNIPKSKFSWEPALILDGDSFKGTDEWIAARTHNHSDTSRSSGKARFVGDADQFVAFLASTGVIKSN